MAVTGPFILQYLDMWYLDLRRLAVALYIL